MNTWRKWMMILLAAVALTLTACGGLGNDRDHDGIPDLEDASPNDPGTFVLFEAAPSLSNPSGGDFSAALAINDGGTVVGLADTGTNIITGARWQVNTKGFETVAEPLASLEANGYSASYDVNKAGVAVGESVRGAYIVPVLWLAAATTPTPLPLLAGGTNGAAYGINEQGTVVGEAQAADQNLVAVVWVNAGADPVALAGLGGAAGAAYCINGNGEIVGEAEDAAGVKKAVFWASSTTPAIELPMLNAADAGAVALNINNGGDIVGEVELVDGSRKGVLWKKDGSGSFTVTDLGLSSAAANNDGTRIVGHATNQVTIWDTRSTNIADHDLVADGKSAGYAVNNNDIVVGIRDNTAFAAARLPLAADATNQENVPQ